MIRFNCHSNFSYQSKRNIECSTFSTADDQSFLRTNTNKYMLKLAKIDFYIKKRKIISINFIIYISTNCNNFSFLSIIMVNVLNKNQVLKLH